jgi:hypothetical protein
MFPPGNLISLSLTVNQCLDRQRGLVSGYRAFSLWHGALKSNLEPGVVQQPCERKLDVECAIFRRIYHKGMS